MECPICRQKFSGNTTQIRFNSHCKRSHPKFYRDRIRPLETRLPRGKVAAHVEDIKTVQQDPKITQKARIMPRLMRKARNNQILRMEFPTRPYKPYPARICIWNPFFVVEHELRIFIGITKEELLAFPVVETLKNYKVDHVAGGAHKQALIANALLQFQETEIETLAARYHFYRKALLAAEDYPEAIARYDNRSIVKSEHRAMLKASIDEERVQAEAEEMYEEYLKNHEIRNQKKEHLLSIENTARFEVGVGGDVYVNLGFGTGARIDPAFYPNIESDNESDIGSNLADMDTRPDKSQLTSELLQMLDTHEPGFTTFEDALFSDPVVQRYVAEELLQCEFAIHSQ